VPLVALVERVRRLAHEATGTRFVETTGTGRDGLPVRARINLALKRIDHLDFDAHAVVEVPLVEVPGCLNEVERVQEGVCGCVGRDGVFVGHETMGRMRRLHFFAANGGAAARALAAYVLDRFAWGLRVQWEADPEWKTLHRWPQGGHHDWTTMGMGGENDGRA
jgi:hypothetical protein